MKMMMVRHRVRCVVVLMVRRSGDGDNDGYGTACVVGFDIDVESLVMASVVEVVKLGFVWVLSSLRWECLGVVWGFLGVAQVEPGMSRGRRERIQGLSEQGGGALEGQRPCAESSYSRPLDVFPGLVIRILASRNHNRKLLER
ncbi:hypothetical protein Droror1_Dr00009571 [Drosera rotundifolia]